MGNSSNKNLKQLSIILVLLSIFLITTCLDRSKFNSSPTNNTDTTTTDYPLTPEVKALLSKMTLAEKIGQMTQAERESINSTNVKNYYIGSVLSGGGSAPDPNTIDEWRNMYDLYQSAALATRLEIPILYGIDAVHGHNNVKDATIFPHNIGLGATRDADLVKRVGQITAKEVAITGLDWTFSPCLAVGRDERWGRTYESFGETPELQDLLAASYIEGLQGTTMSGESIIACAKHYVGDGGTLWDTGYGTYKIDQGDTQVDEETLREIHLPGFIKAIEQNVGTIMVSFSSWNGDRMHGHEYLITDVLKNELQFMGFVISDWNGIDYLPGTNYDKVVASVNAGIDMFMIPSEWAAFITNLTAAVNNNDVSMERINDAVGRILTVKYNSGLFDEPYSDRTMAQADFGSPEHREVAREAVRKSLVLLKNDGDILPLDPSLDIIVAGKNANNIGNQCGGWTMEWQGESGAITTGTTIYEAIDSRGTGTITYSLDGTGAAGYDVAIAVLGETPYAEGKGDSATLALDSTDTTCLTNLYAAGIPVIVIMVSGRPLIVTDQITNWDAFIAAWLPGTEGDGVADLIFGDYNFTGKLPVSWPKNVSQIPINYGDASYDPLFSYGDALSY